MASTYFSLHIHVVFATENRSQTIGADWRSALHAFLGGIARSLDVKPVKIGGVADHVHLLLGLKPIHAVADVVREIKKVSSVWAAERHRGFRWQAGYGAFAVGQAEVGRIVAYIANQEEHHRRVSAAEEFRELLVEYGIEIDERFFE